MSERPTCNDPSEILKEILWIKQHILEINGTLTQIKSTCRPVYKIQNNESNYIPTSPKSSTIPIPPPIVTTPYHDVSPTSMASPTSNKTTPTSMASPTSNKTTPTSMASLKSPSRKVSSEHVLNQLPPNRAIERVPSEYYKSKSTSFYGEIVSEQTYQTQTQQQQQQQLINAQQQALCATPIHKSAIKMSYNGMRLYEHSKPIYYTLSEGVKKHYVIID
jgi:hypothetical protein